MVDEFLSSVGLGLRIRLLSISREETQFILESTCDDLKWHPKPGLPHVRMSAPSSPLGYLDRISDHISQK